MEKSGGVVRPQNPMFAILGLSHIGGKCAGGGVSEWSPSLSVSCFGRSDSTAVESAADHDEKAEASSPAQPTRRLSDDAIVRTLSAKANRRRIAATVDRRPSRPPPPPATNCPSLQVPAERTRQRPSHGHPSRSALASESLIIRPLCGSSAASFGSADRPSTRRVAGARPRTKTVGTSSSRRDLPLPPPLPPTVAPDNSDRRGTCMVAGRHLDVFLPSLVARQTAEADQ